MNQQSQLLRIACLISIVGFHSLLTVNLFKILCRNQEVIMEFEQRIEQLQAEIEQNKNTIASLEQFIVEQKKLMERNKIILENKERDLMMTKKQVDDLAKEKSNLNLRLDLMTRHIEPKEAAIREKGQELEQVFNNNSCKVSQ